jgi:hypothetical protein
MTQFTVCLGLPEQRSAPQLAVAGDPPSDLRYHAARLWIEASIDSPRTGIFHLESTGFVLLFGQAHWRGDFARLLSSSDLAGVLESHRRHDDVCLNELAGNFCLLSYDDQRRTMWIGSDFWGTAAPYYGSGTDRFVASSRAGKVAHELRAAIDTVSYVALMRDATIPNGRTLFAGVNRVTLGQALHLDAQSGKGQVVDLQPLYRRPFTISFRETVQRSIEVIESAVKLAASTANTMVDLTAGNDTRLTAAALLATPALCRDIRFRVTGEPDDADVLAARRIAQIAGVNLTVSAKDVPFGSDIEDLLPVVVAADGFFPILSVANRLASERRHWDTKPGQLVGSTCGELFRNWIWQPELFRMGQTTSVNFGALMHHRIRRDRNADVPRLSSGCLTTQDHDRYLLEPYKRLAALYPDALNTSKLELMYIQQLQNRIMWWPVISHVSVGMPYLWCDVTDVSLRLPWWHKATRRLVTSIVERLAPAIADVPTDRGAPFKPLRSSTLSSYVAYLTAYTSDIARRHYLSRAPIPRRQQQRLAIPLKSEWADAVASGVRLHDDCGFVKSIRENGAASPSIAQRREFLTMLSTELLFRLYPGIRPHLVLE